MLQALAQAQGLYLKNFLTALRHLLFLRNEGVWVNRADKLKVTRSGGGFAVHDLAGSSVRSSAEKGAVLPLGAQ